MNENIDTTPKHSLNIIYLGGVHGTVSLKIKVRGERGSLARVDGMDVYRLMDLACGVKGCKCGQTAMSIFEGDWTVSPKIRIPLEGNEIYVNPIITKELDELPTIPI